MKIPDRIARRFKFSSLRVRLQVLVWAAVIPALLLIISGGVWYRHHEEAEIRDEVVSMVNQEKNSLDRYINSTQQLLFTISHTDVIKEGNPASISAFFREIHNKFPDHTNFGAVDLKGNVFASAVPLKKPVNSSDMFWFQQTLKTRAFTVGKYQIGRIVQRPVIVFGQPVFDRAGNMKSVMFTAMDLKWLSTIWPEAKTPRDSHFIITDRNGTVLFHYPDNVKWTGRNKSDMPLVKTMLAQKEGGLEAVCEDGIKRIYAFTDIGAPESSFHIAVGISKKAAFAQINKILIIKLALLMLVTLTGIVLARMISNRFIIKPLGALHDSAGRFAAGDYSSRTNLSDGYNEIIAYANVFDRMAETIETKTKELRLFRELIDKSNDAIFIADPETGRIIDANERAGISTGYGREELLTMQVMDVDAVTTSYSLWKEHTREIREKGSIILESTHKRKDGSTYPVELNVRYIAVVDHSYILGIARDTTERKKADEQIRNLAGLVDMAPAAIMVVNLEGRIIYANQTAFDLHGYTREEYLALNLHDLDVPESAALIEARTKQILETGTASFEVSHYRKDRTTFPLQVFVKLAEWGGKKVFFSIASDITERKKAEQKLKESEAFLSSVMEGIGEGVVVIDRDLRIISANKGYCEQSKTALPDIKGKHCHEVSHHLDKPCDEFEGGCECTVKKAFQTGQHHRAIHTHYDKFKNPVFIETNAYPLTDETGGVTRVIETLVDVTQLISVQKQLEDMKERYRKLYDNAPDMMQSIGKDGTILICNKRELELLGYAEVELIGQPFTKILPPDMLESGLETFRTLKDTGSVECELEFVAKDGRRIPVFIKSKAIYDDKGDFLMSDGVIRDITEKRKLEEELRHAQKMEAIGTLAGGIAHDFNNMLNIIIGYADIIQMRMKQDDPMWSQLKEILSAGDRAAQLTRGLLTFSRKQVMEIRTINLNEIVEGFRKMLTRIIGEDIDLKITILEKDLTVKADMVQIEQVLMNLAANARDAMPKGGALAIETRSVEIDSEFIKTHGYGEPGGYALITVSDTGVGMDEKTRDRIFEPYFTTKEMGRGTGLGLAIVYGIVTQHNGYLHCYSEPGKGTTFRIYIPLVKAAAEKLEKAEAAAPVGGRETILIAEDDANVRGFMKQVLEGFGYTVVEAVDGRDAVEKFKDNKDRIQLLIFDLIMPGKNGKDAYEDIKGIRHDIRVIFISGYARDIIQRFGIEEGIEFISKPVLPTELLRKVREDLDKGGES